MTPFKENKKTKQKSALKVGAARSRSRRSQKRPSLFLSFSRAARTRGEKPPQRNRERAGVKALRVDASGVNGNGSVSNAEEAVTLTARDAAQFPLVGATTES